MKSLSAYIPIDRRYALMKGETLPSRAEGAVLFADISGYTSLIATLIKKFGPKVGADQGTHYLNQIFEKLIAQIHRYRGSVTGFHGDAITCWFDRDEGLRSARCAVTIQQMVKQFAQKPPIPGATDPLSVKVAIAAGVVRRFQVGRPKRRYIDVLAGQTLDRMAAAEQQARKGEVIVDAAVAAQLGDQATIAEWRAAPETQERFAVLTKLKHHAKVDVIPWPASLLSATGSEVLTAEQARPWLLAPVYERVKQGQYQLLGEYRPVVVLFLRFSGLDYDRDDLAEDKLNRYIQWVQHILARHQGYLIKLSMGDKGSNLMAAFGAPLVHDDDVNGAVAAALALQSLPPQLAFVAGVQIGISRGQMLAGAFGSAARCTYDLLGNEATIAARLMMKAKPGQILVSRGVAAVAIRSHHLDYRGALALKGQTYRMSVFEVLGERSPLAPGFSTHLVAREAELAQMSVLLDAALAGQGQILRLEGAAGVGKSRLAVELAGQATRQGFRVAVGTCESIHQHTPYYPWRQIFRSLLGLEESALTGGNPASLIAEQITQVKARIKEVNPDWLHLIPLLGDLIGLTMLDTETTTLFDPQLRQGALFALVLEIIQTWANDQPLLIIIEDAHWLDEASQNLTLALSRVVSPTPMVLMVVHRPAAGQNEPVLPGLEQANNHHHRLQLQPLSSPHIAEMLANCLPGPPSTLLTSLIQTQTQGNPFFIKELVETLRQTGWLYRRQDRSWRIADEKFEALRRANYLLRETPQQTWVLAPDVQLSTVDLNLPDSIHAAVLARIDRLAEAHKLTLKVASVIGRPFDLALLAQAHPSQPGQNTLREQMATLQASDLIRFEAKSPARPVYQFKHHLVQEALYETLLPGQTPDLHRAVAEALERLLPEAVEELVYHFRRGRVPDKALFYLDKTARKSQREYANETALNYYKQALELETRWTWYQGQVEILHILGRREAEEQALAALATVADAPTAEVDYLWGQYYEALADYPQAQAAFERALAAYQSDDHLPGQIRCLAQLGLIARRQGDYDTATQWYQQSQALFSGDNDHPNEKAQVLIGLGMVHLQQSHYRRATACYDRALIVSRQSGNRVAEAQALNNLGITAFYQRNFAGALKFHRRALAIRRLIGDRAGEGSSLVNLSQVTCDAGNYDKAQDYLLRALTIRQATADRWGEVNVWNDLAIVHLLVGNLPVAQDCLQQGLKLSQKIGDEGGRAYLLGNLALVVRDRGELASAEALLNEGLALVEQQADQYAISYFLSHLGSVSLLAGKPDQAIEQAAAALAIRQKLGLSLWTTADLSTLAAAYLASGNAAKALNYARKALTTLDECRGEGPEFPHRDYFVCYQVLSAGGQTGQAAAALESAYNLIMVRSEKISDLTMRRSFLENVPLNREIIQTVEATRHLSA